MIVTITADRALFTADTEGLALPIYLDKLVTDAFWSTAQATGEDLRVYIDSTQVPVDIVRWSAANHSALVFVRLPSISASGGDVEFDLDVDGIRTEPSKSSTYGAYSVWSDYLAAWSGSDDDRSGNGYDLVRNNTASWSVSGMSVLANNDRAVAELPEIHTWSAGASGMQSALVSGHKTLLSVCKRGTNTSRTGLTFRNNSRPATYSSSPGWFQAPTTTTNAVAGIVSRLGYCYDANVDRRLFSYRFDDGATSYDTEALNYSLPTGAPPYALVMGSARDDTNTERFNGYIDNAWITENVVSEDWFHLDALAHNREVFEELDITNAQAAQGAAYVLCDTESPVQAAQVGAYALCTLGTPVKVTQGVTLMLTEIAIPLAVTQGVVLALADAKACHTTECQIWIIRRTDGEIFRFTTHDQSIEWRGNIYKPCAGLQASAVASAMVSTGNDAGDVQALGILSDDDISPKDVADGLFDSARIQVWRIDWANPEESPIRLVRGILSSASHDGLTYTASVQTPVSRLSTQPLLDVHTASCRWQFTDSRCTINVNSVTDSATVAGTFAINAVTQAHKRAFKVNSNRADNYYDFGTATFTSGRNQGRSSEIKSFENGVITLWEPMPNPISVGDNVKLMAGCNKTKDHCQNKWDNYRNFGGFPDIPGLDSISQSPDAK